MYYKERKKERREEKKKEKKYLKVDTGLSKNARIIGTS